jgi:hypothetical protein
MSLDLTVQLTRQPDGKWIAVTIDSLASRTGIGLGDAELYDTTAESAERWRRCSLNHAEGLRRGGASGVLGEMQPSVLDNN